MRFTNFTNVVTSRYVHHISANNQNNNGVKKRNTRLVRSAQAREERSLSLPPQKPLTDSKTPLQLTAPSSTPLDIENNTRTFSLSCQGLSQQDAITLLAAATFGFSFLAGDLVTFHNLRWLDLGVHFFIREHVSTELHDFARHTMSNTPIVLGWCGWTAAAAALVYNSKNNKTTAASNEKQATGVRHFCLSIAMYLVGGGTILHGDPWLVNIIKHVFQRTRPSELSSTYAFPSGHTTSAAFVIGALLFVILPAVLDTFVRQDTTTSSTSSNSTDEVDKGGKSSNNRLFEVRQLAKNTALQIFWKKENRIVLWILCTATTASGRVLADVHWSTDVIAGACLGTGLVAFTVLACGLSDALVSGREEE